jgi:hypothetical protein
VVGKGANHDDDALWEQNTCLLGKQQTIGTVLKFVVDKDNIRSVVSEVLKRIHRITKTLDVILLLQCPSGEIPVTWIIVYHNDQHGVTSHHF